ncbi:hypothetical protein AVEN_33013-1 [Araneus ventricosus]|uniref:Uncharacterized protein n=1 Tax=Araneus ventricosus TaxID=182803 RepID=A0A4Y2LUA2_ARAVE|nr:hypothetical protein AVEN_33013-1 [Araneus ventricosus]
MTAGTVQILRKPSFSPIASERATLTKKVRAADEKSIRLNERGLKFRNDIRTAIVFCLKRRLGRSRIDRVNHRRPSGECQNEFSLGGCHNFRSAGLLLATISFVDHQGKKPTILT